VTASSFITDWKVNQRSSSSTHRHIPKNFFHILQLEPKKQYFSSSNTSSTTLKSSNQNQDFERVKDILARTYCPHLHTAMEYGYNFGSKSKFLSTQQLITTHNDIIPIKEMPESPSFIDDTVTITLKSPPSSTTITKHDPVILQQSSPLTTTKQDPVVLQPSPPVAKKRERKPKIAQIHEKFPSPERRMSEEVEEMSSVINKQSYVILTPLTLPIPSPPLIDKEKELKGNQKRKSSITINTNNKERKKKRIVSSPSPEYVNHIEDISDAERYDSTPFVLYNTYLYF
jgi:hypothetical protein